MRADELKGLCDEMDIEYPGTKTQAARALLEAAAAVGTDGGEGVDSPSPGSSSSTPAPTVSSGAVPPSPSDVLAAQIARLSEFIAVQQRQFQALQEQVSSGAGAANDEYPDQKFASERDQHEYDVLIKLLRGLSQLTPAMPAQALVCARDALVETAEARAAVLVVADMEGWTTASFMGVGKPVQFLETRWASQFEVAKKRARQEERTSSFRSGQGQRRQRGPGSSPMDSDDDPPSRAPRAREKTVVCYGCGEKGHYSNRCPNEKPKGGSKRPKTPSK